LKEHKFEFFHVCKTGEDFMIKAEGINASSVRIWYEKEGQQHPITNLHDHDVKDINRAVERAFKRKNISPYG